MSVVKGMFVDDAEKLFFLMIDPSAEGLGRTKGKQADLKADN
ncbi:MAG: hypothetical protein NTV34_08750 [Proteobacteria bacterium]|nr:hypothetical protein [Pseudomonadota bacterium]